VSVHKRRILQRRIEFDDKQLDPTTRDASDYLDGVFLRIGRRVINVRIQNRRIPNVRDEYVAGLYLVIVDFFGLDEKQNPSNNTRTVYLRKRRDALDNHSNAARNNQNVFTKMFPTVSDFNGHAYSYGIV